MPLEDEAYKLIRRGAGYRLGLVTASSPVRTDSLELLLHIPRAPNQAGCLRLLEDLVALGYVLSFGEDGWVTAVRPAADLEGEIQNIMGLIIKAEMS